MRSEEQKVHLVDGTYELFRCFFGAPSYKNKMGREVGAARGLFRSLAAWLRAGEVTHVGCAFDYVIESFRNDLFDGYKTGVGIDPNLYGQFRLAEEVTEALGITTWRMMEFEADDAIATAAARFSKSKQVTKVLLCSPDKDLAQCVEGDRVVLWDRRNQLALNDKGVREKFGVPPELIPDLLALVGDPADGIPGIPRWGMKSAAAALAAHGPLEKIPSNATDWKIKIRGADALAESLSKQKRAALLYKQLATLRFDVPLLEKLADLEWKGGDKRALEKLSVELADEKLLSRLEKFQ